MGRQGNKYEPTVAFIVVAFGKTPESHGEAVEIERIYLQDEFVLPISQKTYKSTLKNVEVYVEELMESRKDISSIRLDRISHIKIYER